MFKSWRIGKLLGFPIEINVSFLILLGLVFVAYGGLAGVLITALAFTFVLLHELGHAVVARSLRVEVSGIELGFLGGAAKMTTLPRTANAELLIAAAGPAVSLVLGGAALGLAALFHSPLLALAGWINLVIAGFNLIPALPMDGGRILRAALSKRMDFVRATDVAVTVARGVAIAFVVWAISGGPIQLLVLAPFLWIMGTREKLLARMLEDERAGYGRGVDVMPAGAWERRRGWGAPIRRFTIAHHNGRIVIVPIE